ncbi:MAG: hypothetical protein LBD20_08345 [Spirochaetaceae bacterium]|jgi:hypothetical protein|nr:hypothetical protein [Spirochaetaceae bacterium]
MVNFKAELKRRIQDKVYERVCQYYENGEEKPPKPQTPDFEFDQINQDVEFFNNSWKNAAYIFFSNDLPDCCCDFETTKETMESLNKRNQNKKNCMPKINKEQFPPLKKHEHGYCLYVGSCKKNIKTRMAHHLGKLSGTYGLHLGEWWTKKNDTVKIFVLRFENNINKEYLSLIEDSLWESFKPLFGKKGPR